MANPGIYWVLCARYIPVLFLRPPPYSPTRGSSDQILNIYSSIYAVNRSPYFRKSRACGHDLSLQTVIAGRNGQSPWSKNTQSAPGMTARKTWRGTMPKGTQTSAENTSVNLTDLVGFIAGIDYLSNGFSFWCDSLSQAIFSWISPTNPTKTCCD